jgi:DHA1 family bicyclomycin/chloramphenicol resistance-like MFS transporter
MSTAAPPETPQDAATTARRLGFVEFVTLLALLFATIAYSIDAMLPALTLIAAELSPEAVNRAQLLVTAFVLGLGLGTMFWGPISDSYGRKGIIFFGIALYSVAAVVAAQAQSLEVLLAARFVQGLGAAAPRVVTLAIVRDLYQGREMARVMSIVMTIFILVPAVAPSVGAGIIWLSGWRAVFWSFVVFGIVSGGWLMLRQPETHPPERRRPLRIATIAAAAWEVLRTPRVPAVIGALSLGFGQMFIFLSTAPQLFADVHDREATFPFWFAAVALIAGLSGILNAALVMRLGMRRLATVAFAAQAGVSVLFLAQILFLPLPQPWAFFAFFAYMCAAFFMVGLTFGNLNALALEDLGHIAGLASAVIGSLSTVGAVLIAVPVGLSYDGTPVPLVAGVAVCSALAFGLMLTTRTAEGG